MEVRLNLKEKLETFFSNMWKRRWMIFVYGVVLCVFMIGSYQEGIKDGIINFPRAIILIVAFIIGSICISFFTNLKSIHTVAFLVVLLFGLANAIITPILDSPDETVHLYRSELTSRGDFLPVPDEEGYRVIDSAIELYNDKEKTMLESEQLDSEINYEMKLVYVAAAGNFVVGYLPQAIGINIAKTLHLSSIWILWMGRISNVLLAAFLTRISIKMVSNYKVPLMIMACFPLAVYQAGSLSIDATINYFSLFIIAFFIRLYEKNDNEITGKHVILFFTLCLIPGFSKITYMALSCLLFFIPSRKFKNKNLYYGTLFGIVVMLFLSFGWYYFTTIIPSVPTNQSYASINNIDSAKQLSGIINNPFKFLVLLIREFVFKFGNFSLQFFTFGWLSYGSQFLVGMYLLFFGAIIFMYPNEFVLAKKTRFGLLFICLVVYIGTELIMYLSWTPVAANGIEGVQGRYFIPLLAFFPMSLNLNGTKKVGSKIDLWCLNFIIIFLGCSMILTALTYY